jgi:hypothetical protein
MSELISAKNFDGGLSRRKLLIGVSVAALLSAIPIGGALAEGENRPSVWIELGSQLERVDGGLERLSPTFASQLNPNSFTSPITIETPPRYAIGGEGKLMFQPEGSNWAFSASVRYGRSNNKKKLHQETQPASGYQLASVPLFHLKVTGFVPPDAKQFIGATSRNDESHLVVDFQAGHDVGLGLFGNSSNLSAGLRFAQFTSSSSSVMDADPDFHFSYVHYSHFPPPSGPIPANLSLPKQIWHIDHFDGVVQRSFHGMGPTLAWTESDRLGGDDTTQLAFDWGINAAVLFGRQKVKASHNTTSIRHSALGGSLASPSTAYRYHSAPSRSHSVAVSNVGGFAGLSMRFPSAKVSFGYRADFFFGAMDGGIDARKNYDRNFYGPFATISIGLGG